MSKSLGNTIAPAGRDRGSTAPRSCACGWRRRDYADDQRIGTAILQTTADGYRKLRNTLRYLLGALDGFDEAERVAPAAMPELERSILHRLAELDREVRAGYERFDFQDVFQALFEFCDRRPVGLLLRHPQGRALLRRGRRSCAAAPPAR